MFINNHNIDVLENNSESEIVVIPIEPSMRLPSMVEVSNRINSGLLDQELNAEDLYQHNKEWLTPDEDHSVNVDNVDFNSFVDFNEEADNGLDFSLNYDPSVIAHEDAIKEDNSFAEELKKVEDSINILDNTCPTLANCSSPSDSSNKDLVIVEEKPKKKVGRKKIPTGMEQRKDVVLKKVLRKIRNYYWKDFQTCTNFPIKKRGRADDAFLKDSLNTYIRKVFEQDPKPGMIRTLTNLM